MIIQIPSHCTLEPFNIVTSIAYICHRHDTTIEKESLPNITVVLTPISKLVTAIKKIMYVANIKAVKSLYIRIHNNIYLQNESHNNYSLQVLN